MVVALFRVPPLRAIVHSLIVKVISWSEHVPQIQFVSMHACMQLLCEAAANLFNAASSSNTEEQQAVEDLAEQSLHELGDSS